VRSPNHLYRVGGGFVCIDCGNRFPEAVYHTCAAWSNSGLAKRLRGVSGETLPGCIHRMGPPEAVKCKPCENRGLTLLVYACGVHGRCTMNSTGKRVRGTRPVGCATCEQRE